MNKIVHLSLARKNVPTRIDVVQYATKPDITFVIDDYTPAVGSTASLYIEKPDETLIYNACTIEDNKITYTPTTQSFAVVGQSKCQLQIVETDGTAVSFLIYADVSGNIIDSSAVESQNEFTALEEALQTVSDYDGRIQTNTNNIATNTSNIATNATNISALDTRVGTLEGKQSIIGGYYVGATITTTVPNATPTDVMQVTLPAGTYIIMGGMQWTDSFNSIYAQQLLGFSGDIPEPIVRNNGQNGGGSVITAVARLSAQRTIRLYLYQASGTDRSINRNTLTAVRIA